MIQLINRIRRMLKKWSGNILRMSDNKMVKQVFRCEPVNQEQVITRKAKEAVDGLC